MFGRRASKRATERRLGMSKIVDEVLAENRKYASAFGDKGSLALPSVRS